MDVNLNEDDDEDVRMDDQESEEDGEEDEEEEGDIDLLDVLDGKGDVNINSDEPSSHSPKFEDQVDRDEGKAEISDHSGSGSDSSVAEDGLDFDPSDDEEVPEALDQLNNFISTLDVTSKKRKAAEDPDATTNTRARKRRLAKEKTEAGLENEFRARSSGIFFFFTWSLLSTTFFIDFQTNFRVEIKY